MSVSYVRTFYRVTGLAAITVALTTLCLIVGFACVLLPPSVPIGVVAIASAVLLWTMPDLRATPAGFARATLMPFIFSVVCIPTYFALVFSGLPWLSVRRTMLFVFLIPVVITLASSSGFRRRVAARLQASKVLSVLLVGFWIIVVVDTLASTRLASSISSTINMAMLWLVPFVAILMFIEKPKQIETFSRLILFCVAVNFTIGLIETYLHRPFLIYLIPATMRNQMLAANPGLEGLFVVKGVRNGLYRSASTFNTTLAWGEFSAMMSPIVGHLLAHGRKVADRILGGLGVLMCFGSVFMSGSRGAYVGFIAAAIVYGLLWAIRKGRYDKQSLAGGIALTIYGLMSAGAVFVVFFVGQVHRLVLGGGEVQSSNDGRWAEWALAKPKIIASPIFGYGPGTSGEVIGYYGQGQFPTVDSYIMTLLVDNGIPGFLLFTGMLFAAIYSNVRMYLNDMSEVGEFGGALAASLLAFTIYRITLSQTENHTSMFIIIGLTVVSSAISAHKRAAVEPN